MQPRLASAAGAPTATPPDFSRPGPTRLITIDQTPAPQEYTVRLAGFCGSESRAKGELLAPWIPISEHTFSDCRPCRAGRDDGRCQPTGRQEPRRKAKREQQALLRQGPQGLSHLGQQ